MKVPLVTDWQAIMHACEYQQNDNLQCATRKPCKNDSAPGQQVMKYTLPTKLGVRTEGPSTIERVHVNCNLIILLREGITECINVLRDLLYC